MTVPNQSSHSDEQVTSTGTENHSTEAGEQSRGTSVALIRNWPLTALSLCLFPILLSLGAWQLERSTEKQRLLDAIDARLASQPQSLQSLPKLQKYTPVRALGYYTDEYFYLDNRTRHGEVGYEVLQVFVSDGSRWLINRGFIAAGHDRTQLPSVTYPLAAKVITGFVYPVVDNESRASVPYAPQSRIQSLNSPFSRGLNLSSPQWHIRLSADSDTALITDWHLVNTLPARHRAYAVQWFAMAIALLILWVLAATSARDMVLSSVFNSRRTNQQ